MNPPKTMFQLSGLHCRAFGLQGFRVGLVGFRFLGLGFASLGFLGFRVYGFRVSVWG